MKSSGRSHKRTARTDSRSRRSFVAWLGALGFLVVSALQVAVMTDAVRDRHRQLQSLQAELDAASESYSRLQLELAAVAAYQNIERTAEEELQMSFPAAVERIEP